MRAKRHELPFDEVLAEDRVAGYTATRVPRGGRPTGLPSPAGPPARLPVDSIRPQAPRPVTVGDSGPAVEMHPVQERRRERRWQVALPVSVSHFGAEAPADGMTIDVSRGGMCLRMSEPPTAAHQDVLVVDEAGGSVVWVQVLGHVDAGDGVFLWHVRVTDADPDWEALVRRNSGRRTDRGLLRRARSEGSSELGEVSA